MVSATRSNSVIVPSFNRADLDKCRTQTPEPLKLQVISYEDLKRENPLAIQDICQALRVQGIVGIKGVPTYPEKLGNFIDVARRFSAWSEANKRQYEPKDGSCFGYELGKERFQREDGVWVSDDQKASYYAAIPNVEANVWPDAIDLQTPFSELGDLMLQAGKDILEKMGLAGPSQQISLEEISGVGRMLHYLKESEATNENPLWCGSHFDHGLFTALVPAFYFIGNRRVDEPEAAGLFVKSHEDDTFKKVVADDDVMLFQVGEFGQLVSNDRIRATEHQVRKVTGAVERHTLALFFSPGFETVIDSTSELTSDDRYGSFERCKFQDWHQASLARYKV